MSLEKESSVPKRRLSCSTCFDALWFFYSPVHQMQQYYRIGVLDNCSAKCSVLYDCLTLKTKGSSELQNSAFPTSEVAASALFLAKLILFPESSALLNFSEYRSPDLRDCVFALHVLHMNARTRNEVSSLSKYKDVKFESVRKLLPCKEIPEKFFQDIEPLADNILVETFRFESASGSERQCLRLN